MSGIALLGECKWREGALMEFVRGAEEREIQKRRRGVQGSGWEDFIVRVRPPVQWCHLVIPPGSVGDADAVVELDRFCRLGRGHAGSCRRLRRWDVSREMRRAEKGAEERHVESASDRRRRRRVGESAPAMSSGLG
jgi:hypothetical protein